MSYKKRQKKIGQYPAMLSPRAYLITHSSYRCPPTKESKKIAEKKKIGTSSIKRSFEGDNCLS